MFAVITEFIVVFWMHLFCQFFWHQSLTKLQCRFLRTSQNDDENRSQSYQTLIPSFFWFLLLSLTILKYCQYILMLQTLKPNNKKQKKSSFYEEKSLVGLAPDCYIWRLQVALGETFTHTFSGFDILSNVLTHFLMIWL